MLKPTLVGMLKSMAIYKRFQNLRRDESATTIGSKRALPV